MSFSDFINQEFETNVDGDFQCTRCEEWVTAAFVDIDQHVITWRCSQGHITQLKDFNI